MLLSTCCPGVGPTPQQARDADANSMIRLAKMYLNGQGCQRNIAMAQEWVRKARCVWGGAGHCGIQLTLKQHSRRLSQESSAARGLHMCMRLRPASRCSSVKECPVCLQMSASMQYLPGRFVCSGNERAYIACHQAVLVPGQQLMACLCLDALSVQEHGCSCDP